MTVPNIENKVFKQCMTVLDDILEQRKANVNCEYLSIFIHNKSY